MFKYNTLNTKLKLTDAQGQIICKRIGEAKNNDYDIETINFNNKVIIN